MAKDIQYSPLETQEASNIAEIKRITRELDEAEKILLNRSSKWVFFLCFLQLILTIKTVFFGGSLLSVVLNSLFISIGIVGTAKKNARLMTIHFIYSLVLYVMSLVGIVALVLYCDGEHAIWIYVSGFFLILFQAIGMKHSRKMVVILKSIAIDEKCRMSECALEEIKMEKESVTPQSYPVYPIPSHQFMTMQMQPEQVPQYFVPYDLHDQTQNAFIPIPVVYSQQQQQQ